MKRIVALLLVLILSVSIAIPALATAPVIEEVEYKGLGKVEVEFTRENVRYKDAMVTVMDSNGEQYVATIDRKDNDDLTFTVSEIDADKTYDFTISGVRAGTSGDYGSVSGTFRAPAAKEIDIRHIDYDRGDKELDIEFTTRAQYENLNVEVTDSFGTSYSVKILERDSDSVDIRVSGLAKGTTYTVTVSGIRAKGSSASYGLLTRDFTA